MTDRQTDRRTDGRTDARGKTICLPTLSGGDIIQQGLIKTFSVFCLASCFATNIFDGNALGLVNNYEADQCFFSPILTV